MATRYFELDKNSFSRYLGRSVSLLIELNHSAFDGTWYFCNNTAQIVANGHTYTPFPFDIILAGQKATQGTQMVFSNIHNESANEIKKTIYTNENIIVQLYIASVETENIDIVDAGTFEITQPVITNDSITATINIRHNLDYNLSSMRYNRQLFKNLYL